MMRKPKIFYALSILFFASTVIVHAQQLSDKFTPGEIWPDNKGIHINAHGGGLLKSGKTYFWYGEHKTEGKGGNMALVGVHCYSSNDLYNWTDEGIALPVSDDPKSEINWTRAVWHYRKGMELEGKKDLPEDVKGYIRNVYADEKHRQALR